MFVFDLFSFFVLIVLLHECYENISVAWSRYTVASEPLSFELVERSEELRLFHDPLSILDDRFDA